MDNKSSNQCGVKGCKNTRDHGAFVGPFCAPCDHDLRTGNFQFGTSVVYEQAREIERLRVAVRMSQEAEMPYLREIERLRAALELYGRHTHPNCHDLTLKEDGSFGPRNGCLCGFDAALSGRSAPETTGTCQCGSVMTRLWHCANCGYDAVQAGSSEETSGRPQVFTHGLAPLSAADIDDIAGTAPKTSVPSPRFAGLIGEWRAPKAGDKCGHCGREWLPAPHGGQGVYHECHTGPAAKASATPTPDQIRAYAQAHDDPDLFNSTLNRSVSGEKR